MSKTKVDEPELKPIVSFLNDYAFINIVTKFDQTLQIK